MLCRWRSRGASRLQDWCTTPIGECSKPLCSSARGSRTKGSSLSSSFRRLASYELLVPQRAFRRWNVASLRLSSLAVCETEEPAAGFACASRSVRTICSGVCRFFGESPPSTHLGCSDSHSNWISYRGAGQLVARGVPDQLYCNPL